MSSDSDLDYESANDDTESDTNTISETNENLEKKTIALELISETNEDLEKKTIALEKTATNVDSSLGDEKLVSLGCDSDAAKASPEDVIAEQSTRSKNDGSKVGEELSVAKSESKESTSKVQVKREKQRVPLRLEKKIQQKSKLSKNSPVEIQSYFSNESSLEKKNELPQVSKDKDQHSDEYSKGDPTSNDKSKNDTECIIPNREEKPLSSWGFGGWGSTLLSSAASSVSSFSNQVSQGIGSVLETVESTLGAPSPEELASALREKKERSNDISSKTEAEEEQQEISVGLLPNVSAWTKVIENTGSKVLMGGLDTLELIGKKTIDILTEGDPGLRSKRTIFNERVNLSQILREAKEKADKESENISSFNIDVVHYSQVFDDQQGLVHLEALEMLSKQTQAKFQRLLMRHSRKEEIKKRIEEIKSICENVLAIDDPSECEGFEDFESVFKKYVLELSLPLNVDNIVKTQRKLSDTLIKFENVSEEPYIDPDEIYRSSICCLAEFTARCIETFHKVAELILVQKSLSTDLEQCATNLTGLTTVMGIEINNLSSKYQKCLDSSVDHFPHFENSQGLNITAMVTNLYVEASNSNKYIQDAFQMLVPVLQVSLLENLEE